VTSSLCDTNHGQDFRISYLSGVMLGTAIHKFSKTNKKEKNPMKVRMSGLLLSLMAVALLFSVACDYAAITAPEAPEATNVVSVDEIHSQNEGLFKKGEKDVDESDTTIESDDNDFTRYGWAF